MALIAKEPLYIGNVRAANRGNVVTADAVKKYGWADKVEEDGSELPELDANAAPDDADEGATTRKRRRK